MISAKVDFLQLLVVKATVGRLAVGEPLKVDIMLSCTVPCCAVLCYAGIAKQSLALQDSILYVGCVRLSKTCPEGVTQHVQLVLLNLVQSRKTLASDSSVTAAVIGLV